MYSTCLFCRKSLSANQVIEHLPVGRRLAFDGDQGRLWVVCANCRRWNLTPIEERWEAIEACERLYRTARIRASTGEIGLARLSEGLELVRIGKPPRAELAAWQYVDIFRRRRRRAMIVAAGGTAVFLGVGLGSAAIAGVGVLIQLGIQTAVQMGMVEGVVAEIVGPDGKRIHVTRNQLSSAYWIPPRGDEPLALDFFRQGAWKGPLRTRLRGELAERALRPLLARLNRFTGRPAEVQVAVDQLNREGDPMMRPGAKRIALTSLSPVDRLAFEMSLAERDEQKLLAGELASLAAAWREAEEIAAIADNLFLPESITAWLRRQKRQDS